MGINCLASNRNTLNTNPEKCQTTMAKARTILVIHPETLLPLGVSLTDGVGIVSGFLLGSRGDVNAID
ncbi:MAG: hypothetical protein EA365_09690 [Gloeocapsa sp. DLM2.Bin57]|nr:MAG: hypothetical protein EA365_09690 [Gloeocapsa sp. DLM2.Bin57]